MSGIYKPVMILGNIRSGTTILYNILAVHPDLCWFSNYSNRFPAFPVVSLSHRILDLPLAGSGVAEAISSNNRMALPVPWPREGDRIYHEYCGFGKQKDGVESKLTGDMKFRLRRLVQKHLRYTGRSRFINKQTANNRRIAIMDRVFPDALYIHIIRDGRAVANSTLKVPWWNSTNVWWLGYTPAEWERRGNEPAALAALYWKRSIEEIRVNRELLGDRYIEVRYEELTSDVASVVKKITEFCQLRFPARFAEVIPSSLPDRNRKWRKSLNEKQIEAVYESVGDFLDSLGYSDR